MFWLSSENTNAFLSVFKEQKPETRLKRSVSLFPQDVLVQKLINKREIVVLVHKKYFWLLLSVPLYVSYLYIRSLFGESVFKISEMTGFLVFLVAAVLLLVVKGKKVKIPIVIGLHFAAFLLEYFCMPDLFGSGNQRLWICFLYAVPALLLIEFLTEPDLQISKKNRCNKKKYNDNEYRALFFYSFLAAVAVAVLVYLISDVYRVKAKFDGTAICFFLLFAFYMFCRWQLFSKRTKETEFIRSFFNMLCSLSVLNGLAYVLFVNQFTSDQVRLIFPMFLTTVVFFDAFPAARGLVFDLR